MKKVYLILILLMPGLALAQSDAKKIADNLNASLAPAGSVAGKEVPPKTEKALPPTLGLTKAEIDAGGPISAEIARLDGEMTTGLGKLLNAQTDDAILAGARQWREGFKDRQAALGRFNEWLDAARKAHDCADCVIDASDPKRPRLAKPQTK